MGISYPQAKFLLESRRSGVRFGQTATLGRQTAYLSERDLGRLKAHYGVVSSARFDFGHDYADEFFKDFLAVERLVSIDHSDFEGADQVHDMNLAVDASRHQQFDVLIDGGTLEHVFNFPVAIASCMNLTKSGGNLFMFTVANNHCGHGFYQFSPELMFRIFQPANGFEIAKVVMDVHPFPGGQKSRRHEYYEVNDPAVIRSRVGLVSKSPVMMMVHARKIEHVTPFATAPYQSDYVEKWDRQVPDEPQDTRPLSPMRLLRRKVYRALPEGLREHISGRLQLREFSKNNRRFYRKTDEYS